MSRDKFLNGGAYCRSAFQAVGKTATAAGSGDNTEVSGAWVDRKGTKGISMSAKVVISFEAILTIGQTLSFGFNMQDATDIAGTAAADYGDVVAPTIVATGQSGGETVDDTIEFDVDLSGANEFIRIQATPDLSAGGTDTLKWSSTLILFGDSRQPASKALASLGGPTV